MNRKIRGIFCVLTCSRLIKLRLLIKRRLAYILGYFIRNRRFALIFLSGFTSREYHIVCVDFIVALRRTKGRRRRTLRSPSPPSSGLHLLTPGKSAAAGHICCRCGQGYRQLVSGAVVTRQFRILFGCLCSGLYRSRFNWVVGLWSFVFHYWMEKRRC